MYIIKYDVANKQFTDEHYFKTYTDAERYLFKTGFNKTSNLYSKTFGGWLSDTKAFIMKLKLQSTGEYKIYLKVGGTMEQPHWTHEYVNIISAENADMAIEDWLMKNNLNDERYIVRGKNGKGWSSYYSIICEDI